MAGGGVEVVGTAEVVGGATGGVDVTGLVVDGWGFGHDGSGASGVVTATDGVGLAPERRTCGTLRGAIRSDTGRDVTSQLVATVTAIRPARWAGTRKAISVSACRRKEWTVTPPT